MEAGGRADRHLSGRIPLTGLGRGRPLWAAVIVVALLAAALVADGVRLAGGPATGLQLPTFHGQAAWGPGVRPMPTFALRDQGGRMVTPASQRGRVLVVAFLSSTGHESSAQEARYLAGAEGSLPHAQRPVLDVVSTDPLHDTPGAVAVAARSWGLADSGEYHWLGGTPAALSALRSAFGVTRSTGTSAVYLIDRDGFERAGYLFPFLPNFVGLDLATLAAGTR
jgi:cytochrome oxidase Cu insertion factor (SCO1/SenC/PrrC family)